MIRREQNDKLISCIEEPRKTIVVIAGPRQVGKTTMVKQVLKETSLPSMFFNADAVAPDDNTWIAARWEDARAQICTSFSALVALIRLSCCHTTRCSDNCRMLVMPQPW